MQVQAGAPLIPSRVTNETPTARPTSRRRLFAALVASAVIIYVADQLTKAWVSANLEPDQPHQVIGSLLQLNLTRNPGAAFSIGTGSTWILTAIACAVVVFIVFTARRLGSRGWAIALGLLLGGSLGNLTDRMFRAPGPGRGHVVDFLQLPHWPIFNVADSSIVTAAVLIGLLAFRGISVDGTRAAEDNAQDAEDNALEHAEDNALEHAEDNALEHAEDKAQEPPSLQEPLQGTPNHPAGTAHEASHDG